MDINIKAFEEALSLEKVRKTGLGEISVLDLIQRVLGASRSGAKMAWKRLQENHNDEVVTICHHFKFPGAGQRETPITDFRGAVELIMLLPGKKAAKVRRTAAELLARYLQADIALADDLIQRNDNQKDLEWIDQRIKGKIERKELTGVMSACSAKKCYREISSSTCLTVTSMTPRKFRTERNVKKTRDGMTTSELNMIATTETLIKNNILKCHAHGDEEIIAAAHEVTSKLAPIFQEFRG